MKPRIPKKERMQQAAKAAREALSKAIRPGTANSDINVYGHPVEVPAWVLHMLIDYVDGTFEP